MALAQQVARQEGADAVLALKVPPHSVEAEQSLLGALLLDNQAFDRIADLVAERIPNGAWVLMRTDWSKRTEPAAFLNLREDGPHTPGPSAAAVSPSIGCSTPSIGSTAGIVLCRLPGRRAQRSRPSDRAARAPRSTPGARAGHPGGPRGASEGACRPDSRMTCLHRRGASPIVLSSPLPSDRGGLARITLR